MEQEKVWDAIARPWRECRNHEIEYVSDFLRNKRGRVLDLGCGSGRNFLKRDGLDFYGVDFSSEMVELAKKDGVAKEVKKGYTWDVPYGDGFFDYVIFVAVLHCVDSAEKRRKSLEEAYRVLKRGGEMIVSVWGRGSGRLKNRPKEGFVPWSSRDGERMERYTYIYDYKELKAELEDVGFEIVKGWEDENVCFVVRKN